MLNIFYAHSYYWGKELFHLDTNKIFARLTHADRNKEFMHFTIVHKFLVFSSFSPELFFFVGSNQTSTLKFKRQNLYRSDFNDQNSLSYALKVLDNWKTLLLKRVVTNNGYDKSNFYLANFSVCYLHTSSGHNLFIMFIEFHKVSLNFWGIFTVHIS